MLAFNRNILGQAIQVIEAARKQTACQDTLHQSRLSLDSSGTCTGHLTFGDTIGPHLRHILEHYEAMIIGLPEHGGVKPQLVDYDARAHDREIERDPAAMLKRFSSLIDAMHNWNQSTLDTPVTVGLKGGINGQYDFHTTSSIGRELLFLAGHAIHHFAIIQTDCISHGLALHSNFGKAPATVNYEMSHPAKPAKSESLSPWR